MNCSEFQHISHELARDRVEGREKIEALAHAGECSRCVAYLEQERRLSLKLGFLSQTLHGQEAPTRLESTLIAAFREQAAQANENFGVPLHAGPRYWARQKFWVWGTAAAALAAVIALTFGLLMGRRTPMRASADAAAAGVTSQQTTPANSHRRSDELNQHPPAIQAVRHNRAPRVRAARDTGVADASGFVPLVYCDEMNCGTPGDVVRVELPASSLPMMGLVSDNRSGPIRADVVVGEDGIARAIRLVDY
jgi:hypothetical protein